MPLCPSVTAMTSMHIQAQTASSLEESRDACIPKTLLHTMSLNKCNHGITVSTQVQIWCRRYKVIHNVYRPTEALQKIYHRTGLTGRNYFTLTSSNFVFQICQLYIFILYEKKLFRLDTSYRYSVRLDTTFLDGADPSLVPMHQVRLCPSDKWYNVQDVLCTVSVCPPLIYSIVHYQSFLHVM